MLKKFSVGGWCGRVIIVSALSQRKRVKRESELDKNKLAFILVLLLIWPHLVICMKLYTSEFYVYKRTTFELQ